MELDPDSGLLDSIPSQQGTKILLDYRYNPPRRTAPQTDVTLQGFLPGKVLTLFPRNYHNLEKFAPRPRDDPEPEKGAWRLLTSPSFLL